MRLALLLSLFLASCVSTADWQRLKKENDDLSTRFENNQREGWTKAERDAFRKRVDENAQEIQDVKPADWEKIGTILAWVVGLIFFGEKTPAVLAVFKKFSNRNKEQ